MEKYKLEFKWALIFAAMGLLWMMLERLVGLHDTYIEKHAIFTSIIAIPAVLIYVLALLDKKKNYYNNTMNFKQGFITGMKITVIVALLSPITQYITSTFITPDYFSNAIAYAVAQEQMSQTEAEIYFSLGSYLVQAFVGALMMGTLTSAVVAYVVRSKTRKLSLS